MTPSEQSQLGNLPKAKTKKSRWPSVFWLVPVLALAFVGWLVYRDMAKNGPTLTIRFKQGPGVEEGKTNLRYRGVNVGKVTSVDLTEDHKWVKVKATLQKSAAGIARDGSQFWIVHPEVSAAEIRGLRTIVSGDYIQVRPGSGVRQTDFVGLEEEPVLSADEQGGLEVVLLTAELKSVENGSPVIYRGVKVGEVVKYRLGNEAQTIQVYVHIKKPFAALVRKNTKFWCAGGINVNFSLLGGADISAQSFKTLLGGGVAFATPDQMEAQAPGGTTFRLYDKPEDQWLNWSPAIALSETQTSGEQKVHPE